jgi:AcrR family transcriptional regulator
MPWAPAQAAEHSLHLDAVESPPVDNPCTPATGWRIHPKHVTHSPYDMNTAKKSRTASGGAKAANRAKGSASADAVSPEVSGRQRLIEAAEIEFSQKGFDGASVLAIARRAGVKQPLLNYHFGNKEGLWRAVVENAYVETIRYWMHADAAIDGAAPLSRLRALLRAFAVINILHPAAHSLVFMEVTQAGPRLDWLVNTYMRPFHQALDAVVAECTAAGLLKTYPVEHASIMMTGMLTAVQAAAHLVERIYGAAPMTAAQAEAHAEQAIDALFHGMLAR